MENVANFAPELRTEFKNQYQEQFFAHEVKHHYNLRQPKGDHPTIVYLVVCINGQQVKISTGLKVYPKHWVGNHAKESLILPAVENSNNKILNQQIALYDSRVNEYLSLVNDGQADFDKELFKHYILTGKLMAKKKASAQPIDVAKVLLSYLYKDTSIKDLTKENNERFIKGFGKFLSSYTIYRYEDITQVMIKEYRDWCILNMKGRDGERPKSTSVNHRIECTLSIINKYLVDNGLMTGSQYYDIQIKPLKEDNSDDKIALRDDELTLLYNYRCENEIDEQIRDLFLLECTTGQRIGDIEKVDDLIERKDGRTYINLVQEKSASKVEVDIIFQMALDILDKYNDKLPTFNRKKFNKRIKEIAKEAGIDGEVQTRIEEAGLAGVRTNIKNRWKAISTHTGRRTFVTMLSLRGKTDTEIARYSGHKSLSMVRHYDKSKEGTKVVTMFQELQREHPELILKMIGEDHEHSTGDISLHLRRIEELAVENRELQKEVENSALEQKRAQTIAEINEDAFIRERESNQRWREQRREMEDYGFSREEMDAMERDENDINDIVDFDNSPD